MRFSPRFLLPAIPMGMLAQAAPAYAQNIRVITNLPGCNFRTGMLQASCIPIFIGHLIQIVFSVISVLFILNVIYAGYEIAIGYSTSGEKSKGVDRLRWSIIGLAVSVCAYLILNLAVSIITP
jgi:hypothetical protein